MIITCQVVHEMAEYCDSCCSSCHEDADLGYYSGWMCQSEPPDTPRHKPSGKIFSDLCCTVSKAVSVWTRDDWARAVWIKRKMMREKDE